MSNGEITGLTEDEHYRLRPQIIIGTVTDTKGVREIYTQTTEEPPYPCIQKMDFMCNDGICQLVLEALGNSSDNGLRTKEGGRDPGPIELVLSSKRVRITNYGNHFNIEPMKTIEDRYIGPSGYVLSIEGAFTIPRTGSNFNDDTEGRRANGRNGIGAKAIAYYSNYVHIIAVDNVNKRYAEIETFDQLDRTRTVVEVWPKPIPDPGNPGKFVMPRSGTIDRATPAHVRDFFNATDIKDGYTMVEFEPAFEKVFKKPCISDLEQFRILKLAMDFSLAGFTILTSLLPSDPSVDQTCLDYAGEGISQMNFPAVSPGEFATYLYPQAAFTNFIYTGEFPTISNMRYAIFDAPQEGGMYGMVNGLRTDGGIHVEAIYRAVKDAISGLKEFANIKLTKKLITSHIGILVVVNGTNPMQKAQTKDVLDEIDGKNKMDVTLAPTFATAFRSWDCFKLLLEKGDSDQIVEMQKAAKNAKPVAYSPAAYTGKELPTYAEICEGLSAYSQRDPFWAQKKSGRYVARLAISGKPANVTNHDEKKRLELAAGIFGQLVSIMGLEYGEEYFSPESLRKLKHRGGVIISADQDADGYHIGGLVLAFFHRYWPSLFNHDFFYITNTPLIRIRSKSKQECLHAFFTQEEFEQFCEHNPKYKKLGPSNDLSVDYCKGLGSSDVTDVAYDINHVFLTCVKYTEQSAEALDMAFNKTRADDRKKWILDVLSPDSKIRAQYADELVPRFTMPRENPMSPIEDLKVNTLSLDAFIKTKLSIFAIDQLGRSIPRFDGLKESQAKVVDLLVHTPNTALMKVFQFSGKVAEQMQYHHGDASMNKTIIKMAGTYACSGNHIRVMSKMGQFGDRKFFQKSAAQARYPSVGRHKRLDDEINTEMLKLGIIDSVVIDGTPAERKFIPFKIPFMIANGARAIAVGWSTYCPPHFPADIAKRCMQLCVLTGKVENQRSDMTFDIAKLSAPGGLAVVREYWEGFTGKIQKLEGTKNHTHVANASGDIATSQVSRGYVAVGKYKVDTRRNLIEITEVPPSVSLDAFKKNIEKLMTPVEKVPNSNPISRIVSERMSDDSIYMVVEINEKCEDGPPLLKNPAPLLLMTRGSLSNIFILGVNGEISHYSSVEAYIADYVKYMIVLYGKLKEAKISSIESKYADKLDEMTYIQACLDKTLIPTDYPDVEQFEAKLAELGIVNLKTEVHDRKKTMAEIKKLQDTMAKLEAEIAELEAITPEQMYYNDLSPLYDYYEKAYTYTAEYSIFSQADKDKVDVSTLAIDSELLHAIDKEDDKNGQRDNGSDSDAEGAKSPSSPPATASRAAAPAITRKTPMRLSATNFLKPSEGTIEEPVPVPKRKPAAKRVSKTAVAAADAASPPPKPAAKRASRTARAVAS
jgi:DNA topoisomerase-2